MRHVLTATTAGLLVLVFTATAPAQGYRSYPSNNYSYGSYYGVPGGYAQPYYQPVYPPNAYVQPPFGGSFTYSSPSFGFGIGYGQGYGSNFGIYTQPTYGPVTPWYGHHHHHHHHHH